MRHFGLYSIPSVFLLSTLALVGCGGAGVGSSSSSQSQMASSVPVAAASSSAAALYKSWQATTAYVTGDRVYHEGQYYQAKWWTLDESPTAFSGGAGLPWQPLSASDVGGQASVGSASSAPVDVARYPEWQATKAYVAGDKVSWGQRNYEAKWWNINNDPTQYAGGAGLPWRLLAVETPLSSAAASSSVVAVSSSVAVSQSSVARSSSSLASFSSSLALVSSSAAQVSSSAMASSSESASISAPTNMVAVPSAQGDIVGLSWRDSSANELGFVLERQDNGGTWLPLAVLAAEVVSFADAKVAAGGRYRYRVAATGADRNSDWAYSDEVLVPVALTQGQQLFASHCSACHKEGGIGGDLLSTFVKNRWQGQSYKAFLDKVATMPAPACDATCQNTIASDIWQRAWAYTIAVASQQAAGVRGLRKLTPYEYARTVAATLGVELAATAWPKPHFDGHFKYPTDAERGVFLYDTVLANQQLAHTISESVALSRFNCNGETCSNSTALALAKRMLKRPLSDAEQQAYGAINSADGTRRMIEALLVGPDFNYHIALGEWDPAKSLYRLTPFELASELSYQLWGLPPDDTLLALAESGKLSSYSAIAAQIDTMLADSRFGAHFNEFIRYYSHTYASVSEKPGLSQSIIAAMQQEQSAAVSALMMGNQPTLAQLFNPNTVFADSALAAFYGLENAYPAGASGVKALAAPAHRGGLLHWGITQVVNSDFAATSLVKRGKMIRENLLCHTMGVPVGVDPASIQMPEHPITTRERWDVITGPAASNGQCWQCHQLMNEPGSALENFDQTGRYRTQEAAYNDANVLLAIDAAGTLRDNAGVAVATYANARELAQQLASSEAVKACFVDSYLRFVTGYEADHYTEGVLNALDSQFQGQGDIRQLVLDTLLSDAFLYRLDR